MLACDGTGDCGADEVSGVELVYWSDVDVDSDVDSVSGVVDVSEYLSLGSGSGSGVEVDSAEGSWESGREEA